MEAKVFKKMRSGVLAHIRFTIEEVPAVLKNVKVDKSLGSDQVHHRLLWEAGKQIVGFLAEIFL